jgi:hypothetical protein
VGFIVFIRKQRIYNYGYYNDGSGGTIVYVDACIVSVETTNIIGLFHTVGHPNGLIGPGDDEYRNGDGPADENLIKWIRSFPVCPR